MTLYTEQEELSLCWFLLVGCITAIGQQSSLPDARNPEDQSRQSNAGENGKQHKLSKNHIFWVIPNYRSDESPNEIKPLSPGANLRSRSTTLSIRQHFLSPGYLPACRWRKTSTVPFGQGAVGFGKYYGGAFADQAIGNIMTEVLFPIALHQDPRYFVKGKGGFWKRTGYAISRGVITHGDDGHNHFNTSELLGNAVAAGISNAYYPAADRSLGNTANKWGQQIGLDTAFNIMKEFWPDVRRKLFGQ